MDFSESEDHRLIREAVRDLGRRFGDDYWSECDRTHTFPWAFYEAMDRYTLAQATSGATGEQVIRMHRMFLSGSPAIAEQK